MFIAKYDINSYLKSSFDAVLHCFQWCFNLIKTHLKIILKIHEKLIHLTK